MKKNKISTLLFTVTMCLSLFMCENEKTILNADQTDIRVDTKAFIKSFEVNNSSVQSTRIATPVSDDFTDNTEIINISSLRLDLSHLNNILTKPSDLDVITIVSFSEANNTLGFATYYISNSKLYVKLDYPDVEDILQVNGVVLQDIFYLQEKYFGGTDLKILMSKRREGDADFLWQKTHSDLALVRFREDNFVQDSKTSDLYKRIVEEASQCSLQHVCQRGSGSSCDVWGCNCCRESPGACGFEAVYDFTINNNMPSERQILLDVSDNSQLYLVRNELSQTVRGDTYVSGFYSLSSYFEESLDVNIVLDIVSLATELDNVVNRFLNGNNEILFNDAFYQDVVSICLESVHNSESSEYKETMEVMLTELSDYKNLTVAEVKAKLDQPFE